MSDLLASDFARLIKSQLFRGVIIFCIESIIFEILINYFSKELNQFLVEGLLNTNFIVIGILLSIFIGLFIGSEYSDGTIRNKLIAGNSRAAVYFSNYIVCMIAGFLILAVNFIMVYGISLAVYGPHVYPTYEMAVQETTKMIEKQFVGFYIMAAYIALFVMMTMVICSKPVGTATVMIIAVIMLIAGISIDSSMSEYNTQDLAQETISAESEAEEEVEEEIDPEDFMMNNYARRNNKELSGAKLKVYLVLNKMLPTAQSQKLTRYNALKDPDDYVLYDISIVLVSTVLGLIIFNRKDLK